MEAPLADTSTKTRRLYKSIPPVGPNGSLTQQIKELSLPHFMGPPGTGKQL
jgi:hypothetical protein